MYSVHGRRRESLVTVVSTDWMGPRCQLGLGGREGVEPPPRHRPPEPWRVGVRGHARSDALLLETSESRRTREAESHINYFLS
jgi:hypothetical protein